MLPPRSDFPADFTFGAATSAYQIEGSAQGGAGPSHWDTFAATPGNIIDNSNGSRACDHLNLWPQDLDLIRDAGFEHLFRMREEGDPDENLLALARFLDIPEAKAREIASTEHLFVD